MKKLLVTLGALLAITVLASGNTAAFAIIPAAPVAGDAISLQTEVYGADGCSYIAGTTCGQSADTVEIVVTIGQCDTCICPQLPWHRTVTCAIGVLSAGDYVARYRELFPSPYDPRTELLHFTVAAPTPVRATSWGRLKTLYR